MGSRPRPARAAQDPTASATVVEADRFAGEAKGVADLVATAPGVAVNDYGGLGHLATASIRGSTASGVLVLLDGLPLNTGLGGSVDLSSIPRAWIDRIEIVRGAEGAHYGSGSLGGVINVITRRAPAGTWSAETSAGSFDTYAVSAEGAARAGPASVFLSATGDATSGAFPYLYPETPNDPSGPSLAGRRRTWNGASRAGLMAKAGAPLGEDARLDAVAQVSAGRRELPGWPYLLTPGDLQEDARALLSTRLTTAGLRPDLLVAARASLRLDRLSTRLGGNDATQSGGAATVAAEGRLVHGPGLLRISAEAEGEAFRGTGLDGVPSRATLAATASEDLALGDRARVSPAVRLERVGPFGGVSAKLGGSARVAGPVALRASAGRTFRAPTFAELYLQQGLVDPNPALAPEQGLGGDGGVVLDAAPVYASLGAHATLYRDLIFYQQPGANRLKPFNAGKVLARGLEAEVATAPAPALLGLAISASYTLLATEILKGVEGTLGNEVPHRARHRLYARAAIAPGPATLHLEAHYVGRQYADDANLHPIPAALLWNAGGSVRLLREPSVRLSLEIRNLLDARDQLDAFGDPLPGRMVLLALRAGSTPEGTLP
ncbi:MAG TPA: TonB-dependent receptor [Anaeromyxobacter sp.]